MSGLPNRACELSVCLEPRVDVLDIDHNPALTPRNGGVGKNLAVIVEGLPTRGCQMLGFGILSSL